MLFMQLLLTAYLTCGCGKNDEIHVVQIWESGGAGQGEDEEPAGGDEKAGVCIAMVTDEGTVQDASFNQGVWEGLQSFSKSSGAQVTYIESEKHEDLPENFQKLTDSGYGLVWGVGYNCAQPLLECAGKNPATQYAIVDNAYDDPPENVTGVVFRSQESSFLTGYIAGAMTKTGKLGFVGGSQIASVDSFRYGFMGGAAYAAQVYGKQVDFLCDYTDSFEDPEKGKQIAKEEYAQGCDIVFHAAGGSGVGVIEAAKETGHFVIGVDRDQSYLAPEHVLTSALKNVKVAVRSVSESFALGVKTGGSNLSLGLTEGAVGIPAEHKNYRDEIYDATLLVEDSIKAGQLKPPATEEEYASFLESLQ
ncbi:MAG: BMP family ABC transporter substrate-binding protein [Lachnospiraceae bacterium]|nr:BMP family ABC transporter substrate-binding protein [Lachnospiraceae bacterium]